MLLRSGKVITTTLPKTRTTNKSKCSYCNKSGHKINKCNHPMIKQLNNNVVERTIFSHMVIPYISVSKKYIRLYLCSLSELNLSMLCYYTNIKKYCIEDKKSSYINLLIEYYYQKLNQNLNTLTYMLSVISDENYEKYTNEILNNSVSLNLTFEVEEMILDYVYTYRPPQRKFNIQVVSSQQQSTTKTKTKTNECPICYETYSNAEIIRTGCSHNYCKDCLVSYFKSLNNSNTSPSCACCRKIIITLEIKNKKTRDEILDKYCNAQLLPPDQPIPPPAPQTETNVQQNTYGASSIFQRMIFNFVLF